MKKDFIDFTPNQGGGGEIKDVDMVFVEDVQEVYVGGQPYGKDPIWIEPPKPEIGDYITKSGGFIKFANYQDTDRDNLAGIYIGDNPETGEKLFIPANVGFEYNSNQRGLNWCSSYPIKFDINPSDMTTNSTEVISKFNGKSQTNKILAAAAANDKPDTYFGVANFCKSFAPGFKDGEWYLPSMGELKIIYKSWSNILQSVTKIYPLITSFENWCWSSNQATNESSWRASLKSDKLGYTLVINYTYYYIVPFLAIK